MIRQEGALKGEEDADDGGLQWRGAGQYKASQRAVVPRGRATGATERRPAERRAAAAESSLAHQSASSASLSVTIQRPTQSRRTHQVLRVVLVDDVHLQRPRGAVEGVLRRRVEVELCKRVRGSSTRVSYFTTGESDSPRLQQGLVCLRRRQQRSGRVFPHLADADEPNVGHDDSVRGSLVQGHLNRAGAVLQKRMAKTERKRGFKTSCSGGPTRESSQFWGAGAKGTTAGGRSAAGRHERRTGSPR